jgi:dTDP-4-dehydrorhamnose 3,5-epimerase
MNRICLLRPRRFADDRGWFSETWSRRSFAAATGTDVEFVQDNHSLSRQPYTLRGIHFQRPPHAQAKLVRCVRGRILDIAVDLRKGSPTFGTWQGVEMSAENGLQLYLPAGYGHGFLTLEPDCEVVYKVDDVYAPDCDGGIVWDDPDVGIDWGLPADTMPVLSPKDAGLPRLADFDSPFSYDGVPMGTAETWLTGA